MNIERVLCPTTGEVCTEFTLLNASKDRNPVNGKITIEDEDGVHIFLTEDDPYKEEGTLRDWANAHPDDCQQWQQLGKVGCGAAVGLMGYFKR